MYLLHHLIDYFGKLSPQHPAFRCGGEGLAYGDLRERTDQLAAYLQRLGVKRGDRVGIYLHRSLEGAVAIFGILKAGGVYVPLNPDLPPARTRQILDDCGIRVLISSSLQRRKFPDLLAGNGPVADLIGARFADVPSHDWAQVYAVVAAPSAVRIVSDDLAYIIYTSGSTGTPKGIMHTHRSGLAYARLAATKYGMRAEDRIGIHSAIYFDASLHGYFGATYVGATTVIASAAEVRFPASLLRMMEKEQLTMWYSVPLALIQLLDTPGLPGSDLSRLRWLMFAGEVFPPHLLRRFMQYVPAARASNIYGPTELNQCTYYHLDGPPPPDRPLPLGYVWDDTEARIHDEADRPVPEGTVGELLIRSATCMQGYWRRPELTERAFWSPPDPSGFRRRFYRTGDLAYRDGEGRLMFMGRKDRQVKIRGYRVELEEIEQRLNALEGVGEAVVFTRPTDGGSLQVAARVIPDRDESFDPSGWSKALALHLPAYALPAVFERAATLPRSPTGKIDRLAISGEPHSPSN